MWGSINGEVLLRLLAGGIPGVLIGCSLSGKVPARRLRSAIALIAIALGLQLVYTGGRGLLQEHQRSAATLRQSTRAAVGAWR
jgi:uncharacterized membrane protein YfcA